jgi:hypothetical protein
MLVLCVLFALIEPTNALRVGGPPLRFGRAGPPARGRDT